MLVRISILLLMLGVATSPAIAEQTEVLATSYIVQDIDTGEIIKSHNDHEVRSIASVTKLMTSIVILDSGINLDKVVTVRRQRGMHSKIPNKSKLPLHVLMHLSLMSSDNLATKVLAQNYPGGESAHLAAMNLKAVELGMLDTHYTDPTGLDDTNVSTAQDLSKLVGHAEHYELIKEFSTTVAHKIVVPGKKRKSRTLQFFTTNKLVKNNPDIIISKTGWIRKSGGCLVMLVQEQERRLAIVLLNSRNTHTRLRDGELLYGLEHGKNI